MPWSVDNPPSVARRWPKADRERCITAANAVLQEGGTDEEAIFACIHAAGHAEKGGYGGMEHKTFQSFTVKADGEQGIVEHIVAVTGNVDEGLDRIELGAFTKTIAERANKIRVLDHHQTDSVMRVVGKPLAMKEIGRAELPPDLLRQSPEATGGLLVTTQFLLETPEGKGAFDRIKSGAVNEWSIGFDALDVGYDKATRDGKAITIRSIKTIRLWEYSPVLWGMNPATATLGVKAQDKEMTPRGPVRRLGDVLQGNLHQTCSMLCDSWLIQGLISQEERSIIDTVLTTAMESLTQGIPPEVAALELSGYYDLWQAEGPDEAKSGRVLSSANARKLSSALAEITEVLRTAGLLDDDEKDEEKAVPGQDQATDHQEAGPVNPPTCDLAGELNLLSAELDLMEV